MPSADVQTLLAAAVTALGGVPREGQEQMVDAVHNALSSAEHLLVQAGTGTGKSLGYLVPAVDHAVASGRPVVVATATLALQSQVVDRDLPHLADAVAPLLGRRPTYALVKGRSNYLCLHKLAGGFPEEDAGTLLSVGAVDERAGRLGREVLRLREWAEQTDSGDRDRLVPGVSARAWRQVSVSARECLGQTCPMVNECFVERARAHAREVDVVVTNHSFMAIDAMENRSMLPEHDLLVVDEAHELVDRVTSTITDEIGGSVVAAASRRCGALADGSALLGAADFLASVLDELPEGRLLALPDALVAALVEVRDTARVLLSELKPASGEVDATRKVAQAAVSEVFDTAERLLEEREVDVAWLGRGQGTGTTLYVAPMTVAGLVRDKVLADRTVVLTSATLAVGGKFDSVAGSVGLLTPGAPSWRGLDVGSPFDYPRQGIVYVAKHLPQPTREGTAPAMLDELESLVRAAGGRTLGLFSSMRAATAAAEAMRERLGEDYPVLCQGEDQVATLVRAFAADARTSLFGTLSLWQGVDVPGSACQLVVIDRIPFPRPDDPLASARTQAVARAGGNGFMAVSAAHAALLLAQGSGRLVRRADDRGVVAVLDSRMATARYASYLQASLPAFWPTYDGELVRSALARLDAAAPPPVPVAAPAWAADVPEPGDDSRPVAPDPPVPQGPRSGLSGGQPWTRDEDEELREGAELGLSVEELAEHLGRECESVQQRLAVLSFSTEATA